MFLKDTPTIVTSQTLFDRLLGHNLISQGRILEGKKEHEKAYELSRKAQGISL